jgi:hypothetical protein
MAQFQSGAVTGAAHEAAISPSGMRQSAPEAGSGSPATRPVVPPWPAGDKAGAALPGKESEGAGLFPGAPWRCGVQLARRPQGTLSDKSRVRKAGRLSLRQLLPCLGPRAGSVRAEGPLFRQSAKPQPYRRTAPAAALAAWVPRQVTGRTQRRALCSLTAGKTIHPLEFRRPLHAVCRPVCGHRVRPADRNRCAARPARSAALCTDRDGACRDQPADHGLYRAGPERQPRGGLAGHRRCRGGNPA